MATVLCIDDSELLLQMLQMVCAQAGHQAVVAADFTTARAAYSNQPPDVVVTDLNLPDCDDPVAALQELGDAPIVIVSGRPQAELDTLATERDVAGAISKDGGLGGLSDELGRLLDALVG